MLRSRWCSAGFSLILTVRETRSRGDEWLKSLKAAIEKFFLDWDSRRISMNRLYGYLSATRSLLGCIWVEATYRRIEGRRAAYPQEILYSP